MRVLVAGMGNVLRGDDGFGVAVAERMMQSPTPEEVRILEFGIGGIHLVQELLQERPGGLVVADAVDRGAVPGTVFLIRPSVEDVRSLSLQERHDRLADMHYATPERVFLLARGLAVLPDATWLVGCQPLDADRYGEGLSPEVEAAVEVAVEEIRSVVRGLGVVWETEG